MANQIKLWFDSAEDCWIEKPWLICVSLGVGTAISYVLGIITNIRSLISNTSTFAAISVAIIGIFLTAIVGFKVDEPLAVRAKLANVPNFLHDVTVYLRNQILISVAVVVMSLIVPYLPVCYSKYLSSIVVVIWSSFFWAMTIGVIYSVILVTDIILRESKIPLQKKRI
jgi:hypothetical protein